MSPRKAVIQLTAQYRSDDHHWFNFFREAAHILLHSEKGVFADKTNGDDTERELEANEWASNILVPESAWEKFVAASPRRERVVSLFAEEQGIAPGIVVGMLQHNGFFPWTHLNALKVRLDWKS